MKSLDHRNFFFKDSQKKNLTTKKQVDELKKLSQTTSNKNLNFNNGQNQLTGFYSTYSSFLIHNIQVFPDSALKDTSFLNDHPINLLDP